MNFLHDLPTNSMRLRINAKLLKYYKKCVVSYDVNLSLLKFEMRNKRITKIYTEHTYFDIYYEKIGGVVVIKYSKLVNRSHNDKKSGECLYKNRPFSIIVFCTRNIAIILTSHQTQPNQKLRRK